MARYFMQLRGGAEELLDGEGSEFFSLTALREAVLMAARDLIATDARMGVVDLRLRIDAEDESGAIVHTLGLQQAVTIKTGAKPALSCFADKPRAYSVARPD